MKLCGARPVALLLSDAADRQAIPSIVVVIGREHPGSREKKAAPAGSGRGTHPVMTVRPLKVIRGGRVGTVAGKRQPQGFANRNTVLPVTFRGDFRTCRPDDLRPFSFGRHPLAGLRRLANSRAPGEVLLSLKRSVKEFHDVTFRVDSDTRAVFQRLRLPIARVDPKVLLL